LNATTTLAFFDQVLDDVQSDCDTDFAEKVQRRLMTEAIQFRAFPASEWKVERAGHPGDEGL